jgi:hypothetical protein
MDGYASWTSGTRPMAEWGSIERQLRPQSNSFLVREVSPGVSDMNPALYQLIEYTIFYRWLQALFWVSHDQNEQAYRKPSGCNLKPQSTVAPSEG